jgi:hypothetical protein
MLKNIVSVIMTIAALSLVTVPAFAAAHPGSNHNEPGFHQGGFRNHGGFGWRTCGNCRGSAYWRNIQ